MPHRHPSLRLVHSNPAKDSLTTFVNLEKRLLKRLPKMGSRVQPMTPAEEIVSQTKYRKLIELLPVEAAVVDKMLTNLLAHYYLEHGVHQERDGS